LEIKNFYNHILEIPDHELQSCLWSEVVTKITVSYSESTDSRKKLDAHGIANRIMRKDNYLIAMFNKNILDLKLPGVGERQWMTKLMQDYIAYAIFSFVFDSNGKFRKRFLKLSNKPALVEGYCQTDLG
jgi:autophagy-related protein 9